MKDYSGTYEENVKLHGKKKADEIGSSRIQMYLRHDPVTNKKHPHSIKEHELPYWAKNK